MGTILYPFADLFVTLAGIFQPDLPCRFAFYPQVWKTEKSSCQCTKGVDSPPPPLSFKVSRTRATSAWRPACSWSSCLSTPRWRWCWRSCGTPSTTAKTLSVDETTRQPHRQQRWVFAGHTHTHTRPSDRDKRQQLKVKVHLHSLLMVCMFASLFFFPIKVYTNDCISMIVLMHIFVRRRIYSACTEFEDGVGVKWLW